MASWLRELGLEAHVPAFAKHRMCGAALRALYELAFRARVPAPLQQLSPLLRDELHMRTLGERLHFIHGLQTLFAP